MENKVMVFSGVGCFHPTLLYILIPNPDDPKNISSSQQSYDARLENFKKLKELLEEEPLYNPNENDLKITTLTTQGFLHSYKELIHIRKGSEYIRKGL